MDSAAKAASGWVAVAARLKSCPSRWCPSRNLRPQNFAEFISVTRSHMRRSSSRHRRGHVYGRGVRHEGDDGPEDHDDQADPDPGDQRIYVRFDDGASVGLVLAFVDQVEIAHQQEILAEAG